MDVHIRWMIRRDMKEVLAIENASFEFPWSEEDFVDCLRQRNVIGKIATLCDACDPVVAFLIYELYSNRLELLNFAVSPGLRRQGIGRQMVDHLIGKLSFARRSRIKTQVRESNLDGQVFLRDQGFKAIGVLNEVYEETDEYAYLMEYVLKDKSKGYVPTNRITEFLGGKRRRGGDGTRASFGTGDRAGG